jgi:cardiolipin synthase
MLYKNLNGKFNTIACCGSGSAPFAFLPLSLNQGNAMPVRKNAGAYTVHNKLRVVRGGIDYFNCIEEIADKACHSIHLQTYIFDADDTGKKVAAALMRAAKRNVQVHLLVDGYASQGLPRAFIDELSDAGVHFGFFQPLLKSDNFYIGRRLHHKVMVADAQMCVVAGINVSNRYNDIGQTKAWLDWAIYAEGEVAKTLTHTCVEVWNRSGLRKRCKDNTRKLKITPPADVCNVRVRRNDWVYKKTDITKSYRDVFRHAQQHVTLMTSYFWPPQKLLKGMAAASRRGVKIRVVLTAKADVMFSKYAERYLYQWLFRNNIEIYEYESNILHGKITTYDNKWLTAGSYNVNNISAFASVELNLDVDNADIAMQVSAQLEQIIENDCKLITRDDFSAANSRARRLLFYFSYRLVHFIFYLFTFYFTQKRGRG